MKQLKKVGHCLFFISYNLTFVSVLFYAPYHFYKNRLEKLSRIPENYYQDEIVDLDTSKRLGYIRTESTGRKSRFLNFPREKKLGITRIGCLGDSFTFGDEVAVNHDFPLLLQRKYEEAGVKNVEVINFGNSSHGFHQAFMTWKYIAQNYYLDSLILGAKTFYQERDPTFNHAVELAPGYIHSRYVLSEGGLRLVDVRGSTPKETFNNYNSFLPALDVLMYDWNSPAVLRAVLPANRQLKNPFYYYQGAVDSEESFKCSVLTERMSA